jgi:uncharacterized protein YcbX
MSSMQITALYIYPVKSMRGISLASANLTPQGLDHDRRRMVVRENGRFVTQRDLPQLALIETCLSEDGIELSREGHGSIQVPTRPIAGERMSTKVWGDPCEVIDQGEEISRWLTSALNTEENLRLVCMAPDFIRPQSQAENLGENTTTAFADAAPFLVANEASLEVLNHELESRGHDTVPMNRFRPNIVVRGLEPFAEHRISDMSSDNYRLKFCHPCQRCVVTTIDQETAARSSNWQPYKTLRDLNPMPGNETAPAFAQNATLAHGNGQKISIGDAARDSAQP